MTDEPHHFQLPATFNLPKSQLQLYGEIVYCDGDDYLSRCGKGKDSLERFTAVVAWSISTTRPPIFGFAPYNPVLGETHHVSRGSLHVLLEQATQLVKNYSFSEKTHSIFFNNVNDHMTLLFEKNDHMTLTFSGVS